MITSNYQSPSFGCIRLKTGGFGFLLEQEGAPAVRLLRQNQDNFNHFNWHLDIDGGGYKLVHPKNQQEYTAPFSVKKHYDKGSISVLMKNINNNTVSFSIPCTKEEIARLYKAVKHSEGLEKMLKILKVLEHKKETV